MVATSDQLGAIFEGDPICQLVRHPVCENAGDLIAAGWATADPPLDGVADPHPPQGLGAPIGHQGLRISCYAINAGMRASSKKIDRVPEAVAAARNAVQS